MQGLTCQFSYDIFAIGLVTTMLGVVYWQGTSAKGAIPESADTAIKVATAGGTVLGQLGFGFLADVVGRKRMYGLELILIIFATLAQSLSADSPAITIVGVIIFWRVLMGIGIGGGKSSTARVRCDQKELISRKITRSPPSSLPSSLPPNGVEP